MEAILVHASSVLRATPRRWEDLTSRMAAELIRRPPAPGEWSALDCLVHLVETEQAVFPVRVRALLADRDFEAFDPHAQEEARTSADQAAALAKLFSRLRAESLKVLDRLEEADLARSARHPELGRVTLAELLHEWAGHDLMHTVQAERALMQPFIHGSGPWKVYFADHAVSG